MKPHQLSEWKSVGDKPCDQTCECLRCHEEFTNTSHDWYSKRWDNVGYLMEVCHTCGEIHETFPGLDKYIGKYDDDIVNGGDWS